MLTLAFDTSSKTASVSLLRDETVLYDTLINKGLNHSEVLLPSIDEACRLTGIKLPEIDLFACTLGPGSFTGLRIGVSTLKALMMATGKPAAGVSTLAALALNVDEKEKIIGSMMDAGRGQVYLAYYQYGQDGILNQLEAARALDPQSILDPYEEQVIYVGDGAIKYAGVVGSLSANKNKLAPAEQQFVCASAVGTLAIEKYRRNDLLDLAGCAPVYLRSADALPKKQMLP
ncbi:MAG: tRNA (adenosine(37)-N6)-threonylcarbamoyltransferase complex dimerization subunit type 1 TsaB [Deltaproteobacteria bacterium HGW-Deltaproteobacteria-6]|jgi:tRNA threonylcarbamoyladenosine biosynthesis protein TsaB|nr:MAG: tRNA (adenosine(37)-N6)-threonylcarbamoyltransferase complex dimerization subunit type 1 TsaB [Deltaproteobacteria bacterium HGW-Deltaproteobacteria-6]